MTSGAEDSQMGGNKHEFLRLLLWEEEGMGKGRDFLLGIDNVGLGIAMGD
jgi:hypothetical protein